MTGSRIADLVDSIMYFGVVGIGVFTPIVFGLYGTFFLK